MSKKNMFIQILHEMNILAPSQISLAFRSYHNEGLKKNIYFASCELKNEYVCCITYISRLYISPYFLP